MPASRPLGLACCLAALLVSPAPAGTARKIQVVADKAPDCSSLKAVVASVTRGCKTNDEKAVALYNFMLLTHYHQGYPGEPGGLGALKEINVYGWSLCGGLHTVEAALWREAGWPWRFVGWSNPGHTTVECQYGGRWHYLDVFLRFYAWAPDKAAPGGRTIASEQYIKDHPDLLKGGLEFDRGRGVYYHKGNRFEVIGEKANWRAPSFLSCGDEPGGILTGVRSSNRAGSPTGWAGLVFDSPGYSTDVDLAPGGALTLGWEPVQGAHWWNGRKYVPGHGCGDKDFRNCPAIGPLMEPYLGTSGPKRSFANGALSFAPDFSRNFLPDLAGKENVRFAGGRLVPLDPGKPASVTVALQSPYVMTRASGKAAGADSAAVSLDGGKTFTPVKLDDFSEAVGGRYACLVKLTFKKALTSLSLRAVVQCNRGSLPYLSPGKNRVTVRAADLGDNRLAVTYAYHKGYRSKSYAELADAGAEVARAHHAVWDAGPTVVQKVFTAKDLPATFDVDVPTPKGKHPVYPRMVFLRREVLAPGAKPLPLPGGARAAKAAPGDELKTLPNPFTVGLDRPPSKPKRPTTLRTVPLKVGGAVSQDGRARANHFLKWKKGETWALLVGGALKGLPAARAIASARLVFPLTRGHDKSATKAGVTLLAGPFEENKRFDFKNLGEVVGSEVVPRQPGAAAYSPPRRFAVDVTRAVKKVAAGEARFYGFALRVVPDRGVDDGWTTRLDLPDDAGVSLELEVYRD